MQNATLVSIIELRSKLTDVGITFIEGSDKEEFLSYKELYNSALRVLSFLQEQGVQYGDELVFQLDSSKAFVITFWAAVLGGIIPIPLTIGRNESNRKKLLNVLEVLNNPFLIIQQNNFEKLQEHVESEFTIDLYNKIQGKTLFIEDIFSGKGKGKVYTPNEEDIAYVQFSSGSTGNPKGVTLTHKNLITNAKAILKGMKPPETGDTFFTWMPLTHDMGLIGFHITPTVAGWQHYVMPTEIFIRRPILWLQKVSEHKATFTASPNFGYRYILNRFNEKSFEGVDLSNLRLIGNGAEPISSLLCDEFTKKLSPYGLKNNTILPVYGLAEASLAVTFSEPEDEVKTIRIDRASLYVGAKIVEISSNGGVTFVSVGKVLEYCFVSIADNLNNKLGSNTIGHILIKGGNVTSGYYNNPEATEKVKASDGWLDTGDLGFINNDCLYITGRAKDILFINGQNYYPHDIEQSLEEVEGIDLGKVVVGGCTDENSGKEDILVFILNRGKLDKFAQLVLQVRKHINNIFGFEPDYIIPVREIPKTTSGKVQRYKLVKNYKKKVNCDTIKELDDLLMGMQGGNCAPESEMEERLYKIWVTILQYENFGVTDKFFEIGGNSLNGAQALFEIHQVFDIRLNYSTLFEKQTIREIAMELELHKPIPYIAIPKTNGVVSHSLSHVQERLYYIWEVDKTSVAYNIPVAFHIKGEIDTDRLNRAIIKIIERHDVLRSSFLLNNGKPKQTINDEFKFSLTTSDINPTNILAELKDRVNPFNLNDAPLLRAELLKLPRRNCILFLDFHHIISDGTSISLFIDELLEVYTGGTLSALDIQYKDYVSWLNGNTELLKIKEQEKYWKRQFEDGVPVLNLPVDFARPPLIDYKGEKLEFCLDERFTSRLKALACQQDTTLFTLLLTAYTVLLSKYTGQEDIVVGIPVAGRNHPQLQPLMGMFVNNLLMRGNPRGDTTFCEFLQDIKENSLFALNNQDYPFGELISQTAANRTSSRNSLFDTMFIYQGMKLPKMKEDSFSVERYFFDPGFSKYDISLEIFENTNFLNYYIEYSTALFKQGTIRRFATHFENILHSIVESPKNKILDISIINQEEINHYVYEFNKMEADYPKDKAIHQLIEEQRLKTPHQIAATYGDIIVSLSRNGAHELGIEKLTFEELDNKASQFANLLKGRGVVSNIPVAVILDRSPELIIAILGTLKAGGCYLPINKDLPEERVKYILEDSKCKILVTTADNKPINSSSRIDKINIDDCGQYSNKTTSIKNINNPDDLAYIIYTSGTTGNPKGVKVGHQQLVNYAIWANKMYIKGEKVMFPLYTSVSFDLTVTSIFPPLLSGNTIAIYPENDKSLPIEDVISDNQIHVIKATPSHLKMIKEVKAFKTRGYKSNIKRFIVGGEALTTQLAKDIHETFEGRIEIYNEYGPTETTVGCMVYKYDAKEDIGQSVPIGIPIANTQVYILDKYLKPTPIGVIGELYISGDCVAQGYLNKPRLTEEKFIDNPFCKGQKVYKSGDLVKRLSDGNIEFIGRLDRQVKIKGYRVELEEIVQRILECQNTKEALAVVKQDKVDGASLWAYVVFEEEKTVKQGMASRLYFGRISRMRKYLATYLPHYMVPKNIVPIDAIPLTKNGKVDYSLLPEPQIENKVIKTRAKNNIEKVMISIWQDVLLESEIGITDNFFELGGDSIKAVQIASRLSEQYITVNVKDILTLHTIEQLCLSAEITDGTIHYEQGIVEGEVGINPIQRWFLEQKFEAPNYYFQSVLLRFKEPINKEILQKTFKILLKHHDGLRINYNSSKEVMYYNNDYLNEEFVIEEYKIGSCNNGDSLQAACDKVRSMFNIENTLLIKVAIIKGNNTDLLFITAHHLIIDGVSWRVLLEDFYNVYNFVNKKLTIKLPPKTASLKDWDEKLQTYTKTKILKQQVDYWIKEKDSKFQILQDSNIEKKLMKDLAKVVIQLQQEETGFLLKEANKPYSTNAEILLVTALSMALKNNEVVIEMENHGRHMEGTDVSRTIGWFTSMFPIKFNFDSYNIGDRIKHVKEKINGIPNNGFGYGLINSKDTAFDRNGVLSDVRFNYLGQFGKEVENSLFSYQNINTGIDIDVQNHATAIIEVNVMVVGGKLNVEIGYARSTLEKTTMVDFVRNFESSLWGILDYLKDENNTHFTPSDFDAVELDEEDLKVLFG